MTKEEAIAKSETKWWLSATPEEIVSFQLFEDLLCCPFSIFHEAVEKVFKRSIWTHEFANYKALREEYLGKRDFSGPTESLKEILGEEGFNKKVIITEF